MRVPGFEPVPDFGEARLAPFATHALYPYVLKFHIYGAEINDIATSNNIDISDIDSGAIKE